MPNTTGNAPKRTRPGSFSDCCTLARSSNIRKVNPLEHQTLPEQKGQAVKPAGWFIILLLGALSLITPFSVDMYLPAFDRIAADFHTTTSAISLSLSTYF